MNYFILKYLDSDQWAIVDCYPELPFSDNPRYPVKGINEFYSKIENNLTSNRVKYATCHWEELKDIIEEGRLFRDPTRIP